jgi:hypothetical protein
MDASANVDIALLQLDPGLKYKLHIQEINAVAGVQSPTVDLAVQKRGKATGLTQGIVRNIALSGHIAVGMQLRTFRNVIVVESSVLDTGGKTRRAFGQAGDSGSAIVTTGPGPPKVVGVMFAGRGDGNVYATSIAEILSAFPQHGLSFDLAAGVNADAVQTVPAPANAFEALDPVDARATNTALDGPLFANLGERARKVELEVAAITQGRGYIELVSRHFSEAFDLVNTNRRVATVWHRSGGPELLNAALRTLRFDDEPLPREINGRPLTECITRVMRIFMRYASPDFAHDLARQTAPPADLSGLTYPQMLAALRAGRQE